MTSERESDPAGNEATLGSLYEEMARLKRSVERLLRERDAMLSVVSAARPALALLVELAESVGFETDEGKVVNKLDNALAELASVQEGT